MTNEQFIKHLREEYSKSLHLSSNLEDSDADYDYLDGVLDGRMRTLRRIIDLITINPIE
nr:MAG TPA: hypothetical protein [Caudoviricetes sp.]